MENKRFYLRHPLLAALILPILCEIWVSLPSLFPVAFGLKDNKKIDFIMYILGAVFAMLLLAMHKYHYRPIFRGSFKKEGFSDRTSWICIGLIIAVDIILYIISGITDGFPPFNLTYLIPSINAGACEETVFRAIPISVIMFSFRKKDSSWPVLFLTSVIFGLFHLFNLKGGAKVPITILQVITAGISGLFCGSLYLRTGNILLPMLTHAAHDFTSFLGLDSYSALVIDITPDIIIQEIIIAVVEIVCTIILMKDQKLIHIPVWNERWSDTEDQISNHDT